MIKAIVVCEGDYCETRSFRDEQHLSDFYHGFSEGANHYGAGGFGIYTLEDAETEDDEGLIAMIREHLEEKNSDS